MTVRVRSYEASDAERWDAFCADARPATFLHSRRFLSYHGNRFQDRSLLLFDGNDSLLGLFPAALDPGDDRSVVSHPGCTYGGVVHHGALTGDAMVEALCAIADQYAAEGAQRLIYKPVPFFYHQGPAQDDLWALFRLDATRVRCDLSSTIDLDFPLPLGSRRKRSLAKAKKAGVTVVEGSAHLAELWDVLAENLDRKHGSAPVHRIDEIRLLADRFPDSVRCVAARLDGALVAGVVLFDTPIARHAQYIAASEDGQRVSALDAVFEHCIAAARRSGQRWFDFGISNERDGRLNQGLHRFKSEFGSGGAVHEHYQLPLPAALAHGRSIR